MKRSELRIPMPTTTAPYQITWEKLPDDFVLDDRPVDNINQPLLAAALTESLELAGRLPDNALVTTNYGICATVNGKLVIKAPDWSYVPSIRVARNDIKRSYTPQLQGDIPAVAIEFLSDVEGNEYSTKPTYPPGKWFFYEQILRVPSYAIFEPETGILEVYALDDLGQYQLREPDVNDRHFIAGVNLFLGVWQGSRESRSGFWLRWWDGESLLLWRSEWVKLERQRTDQEQQRADQERQRADRLANQLRAAGIEPEE